MATAPAPPPKKLHGRAFYESIGSPKFVVAPMVDQSEFAWRMLTRSLMPESSRSQLLAYTPMLHARLFSSDPKYRQAHFQATRDGKAWLDGNASLGDRPLFVQFCANDATTLLEAAQRVAPYCDAVDLNLGCPQGIARKGRYGAFLQEDQHLIFQLVNRLHRELSIPVTAKIRILDTKEETLAYAQNVLKAGASILTVHGRRREQKGHLTGVADWDVLRFLRRHLPAETVIFANGNVLQFADLHRCLRETGADAVMSAEGNLSDPAIFAGIPLPVHDVDDDDGGAGREFWRGRVESHGAGWRVDALMRRYLDILYLYALETTPPHRQPLFIPSDDKSNLKPFLSTTTANPPPSKRRKTTCSCSSSSLASSPNLSAIQPHLFHLLRHLISRHTDVRDMLVRVSRNGGLDGYEDLLSAVEEKVGLGLMEYEESDGKCFDEEIDALPLPVDDNDVDLVVSSSSSSSAATVRRCRRPWWVAQPIIRPLPAEALAKGAITMSKKTKGASRGAAAAAAAAAAVAVVDAVADGSTGC
ncbi:hypothetical protein XA68_12304 [Ophiocordyceps unilateralis]|uniref:tRNA-dihydrouridine(16/17) synthase [NAD(P)(+)] n=1 Tax=Ophiocordyceps unilateralis TaxID=268505 RepID=A0A2A9PDH6_OPHUN|nr:hypothetical protein XA68_12304 [Ophiocordyceps unilateralis]